MNTQRFNRFMWVTGLLLTLAGLGCCIFSGGDLTQSLLPLGAPNLPFDGLGFAQGLMLLIAGGLINYQAEKQLGFPNCPEQF